MCVCVCGDGVCAIRRDAVGRRRGEDRNRFRRGGDVDGWNDVCCVGVNGWYLGCVGWGCECGGVCVCDECGGVVGGRGVRVARDSSVDAARADAVILFVWMFVVCVCCVCFFVIMYFCNNVKLVVEFVCVWKCVVVFFDEDERRVFVFRVYAYVVVDVIVC